MSNFFHTWKTASRETCRLPWSGGENGRYFRCGLCGHKFIEGDEYFLLYTNDMPKSGGNPIVCRKCGGEKSLDEMRAMWQDHCGQFDKIREQFWSFFKRLSDD